MRVIRSFCTGLATLLIPDKWLMSLSSDRHFTFDKLIEYKLVIYLSHLSKNSSFVLEGSRNFDVFIDLGCGDPISSWIAARIMLGSEVDIVCLEKHPIDRIERGIKKFLLIYQRIGAVGFLNRMWTAFASLPETMIDKKLKDEFLMLVDNYEELYSEVLSRLSGSGAEIDRSITVLDQLLHEEALMGKEVYLFSQSVLEHVEDIYVLAGQLSLLKASGLYQSHWVDLRSHNETKHPMGHMELPKWVWSVMRGRKQNFLSRRSISEYEMAFEIFQLQVSFERFTALNQKKIESGFLLHG